MLLLVCPLPIFVSGYTLAFFVSMEQFSFPLALQQTIYDNEDGEQISLPAPSLYGFQGKGSAGGALGDPPDCSPSGLPRRAAGRGKWSPWCLRSRREVSPEMGRGKELPLRPPAAGAPLSASRPPAEAAVRGCAETRGVERSAEMRPACRSCHHPARSPT